MSKNVYSYNGYQYNPHVDMEYDYGQISLKKIFHDVTTPEGHTIHFDCSPYHKPTREEFELWIDLGCPERIKGNFKSCQDIEDAQDGVYNSY